VSIEERQESSKVRVARFIASVGEGNIFTKQDLITAVPGVSQADRRMRDLREIGWKIDNYKDNPRLRPDQYLLQTIGVKVHDGEKPDRDLGRKAITGAKRRRVLDRDGNTCQVCFTPGGAEYFDAPGRVARLTIGHILPVARGGGDEDTNLRAECQRCNEDARDLTVNPPDLGEIKMRVRSVGGRKDKAELFQWMQRGSRPQSDKEKLFTDWARLPYAQRQEVQLELATQFLSDDEA
jgi:hypothetical protein